MGAARGEIEDELTRRIQDALNSSNLDFVKIRFLALQGIHPPVDTASAFQEVIGAEQKSAASIRSAEADKNKRLTLVAGTTDRAVRLAEAILEKGRIESDPQSGEAERESVKKRVEELFVGNAEKGISPIGGEAAQRVFEARAERWRLENQAYGRSVKFRQERIAKDAAPQVYTTNKYLEALAESMQAIRKYVIGDIGEPILQFNLQDSTSVPIDVDIEAEK
jgi:regulator of protease activity HflC (stomatin/prohibitin superfamily)